MAKEVEQVDVTREDERPLRAPAVDIVELDSEYVLSAEMPGVGREDAELTVDEGVLYVRGKATCACPGKVDHQEFARADFERAFSLSDDVDPAKITAEVEDGVLRVHLAKREQAKLRKIKIKPA